MPLSSLRAAKIAKETVNMAGWVKAVFFNSSSGPENIISERGKPSAESASSKTLLAAG